MALADTGNRRRWMQKAAARMRQHGTVGAFTKWCREQGHKGVTEACIAEGLRSNNPTIRKRANFARTARKVARRKRTKT